MSTNRHKAVLVVGAGIITALVSLFLAPIIGRTTAVFVTVLVLVSLLALLSWLWRQLPPESESSEGLDRFTAFDTTLRIGDETMPYLRQGLNQESAQKITAIIKSIIEADAVAITDTSEILGFSGDGCRRHHAGGPILTRGTKVVLKTGQPMIVNDPNILACDEAGCPHPLKAAVIVPLKFRGEVVGTFKIYSKKAQPLPAYVARLAVIITQLLGLQMELAEADRHRQLVTKARLEALQAQIRPHFLFNVLNTIISFSRTDVEKARELLVQLASFFRKSLSYRENWITVQDEIEYVQTYLALEKARMGDKLKVRLGLDPKAMGQRIPVLTLQPLVENAVLHGIGPSEDGGTVAIRVRRVQGEIRVSIMDSGVGMTTERLRAVLEEGFSQNLGIGLSNVNERMLSLYGPRYRLRIRSRPGVGTAVRLRIPLQYDSTAAGAPAVGSAPMHVGQEDSVR